MNGLLIHSLTIINGNTLIKVKKKSYHKKKRCKLKKINYLMKLLNDQ